ncbi:MAG: NfeD family protein [Cyanobacteriota bacterium]|nr:NfeD family protein [Cyanobacteriota bacterium]
MSPETSGRDRNVWQGEAVVDEEIQPHRVGRVRFRGSYWNARCSDRITFVPGETVMVVGRDNITLLVKRLSWD